MYTPITSPRGNVVHGTSLRVAAETVCGKKVRGWCVGRREIDCIDCLQRLIALIRAENPRARRLDR